jgi:kinesin family protein 6/9
VESKEPQSSVKTVSKLNLVDLSGSERVSKTQVNGQILREACHINLSLHFLEVVITRLNKNSSGEGNLPIPYRNSMMTMVLKDR